MIPHIGIVWFLVQTVIIVFSHGIDPNTNSRIFGVQSQKTFDKKNVNNDFRNIVRNLEILFARRLFDVLTTAETMLGDFNVHHESEFYVMQNPSVQTMVTLDFVKDNFTAALLTADSALKNITANVLQSECSSDLSTSTSDVVSCLLDHFSKLVNNGQIMVNDLITGTSDVHMVAANWHNMYRTTSEGFGRSWHVWKEFASKSIKDVEVHISNAKSLIKSDMNQAIKQLAIDCSKNLDKNPASVMLQSTVKKLLELVNGQIALQSTSFGNIQMDNHKAALFIQISEAMKNLGMHDTNHFATIAHNIQISPLSGDGHTLNVIVSVAKRYFLKLDTILTPYHQSIMSKWMQVWESSADKNNDEFVQLRSAFEHSLQLAHSWDARKMLIDHVLEQGLHIFLGLFQIYEEGLEDESFLEEIAISLSMARFSFWGVSFEKLCEKYGNSYKEFRDVFRVVEFPNGLCDDGTNSTSDSDPVTLCKCIESLSMDTMNSNEAVRMARLDSLQRATDLI